MENLLDGSFKRAGNSEGQAERGVVLAILDGIHGLPRYADPAPEFSLTPALSQPQFSDPIVQDRFLLSGLPDIGAEQDDVKQT